MWNAFGVERAALQALAENWPDATTRKLLAERATGDENDWLKREANALLERMKAEG